MVLRGLINMLVIALLRPCPTSPQHPHRDSGDPSPLLLNNFRLSFASRQQGMIRKKSGSSRKKILLAPVKTLLRRGTGFAHAACACAHRRSRACPASLGARMACGRVIRWRAVRAEGERLLAALRAELGRCQCRINLLERKPEWIT